VSVLGLIGRFMSGVAPVVAGIAVLGGAGTASAAVPDAKLLGMYQPVTRLDPVEHFRPSSVQSFIADTDLERLEAGSWVVVETDPEPGELPAPGTGVWRLNQDSCTPAMVLGGLACYAGAANEGARSRVVYGRVARQVGLTILQYWLFYYDNVYSYVYPPSDALWQAHEGDWEVVNVVLSADQEPLYVGYSRHCLGARRPWATTPRWEETHPIVYVAVGSHANYFSAGTHPFDPRCVPVELQVLLGLFGLPLPSDHVSEGGEVGGPPGSGGRATQVARVGDAVPSWTAFDGFWGELQYIHFPLFGTVPFGTSPKGPGQHAVWTDPLGTLSTWPVG
jgi:hypothetical protein